MIKKLLILAILIPLSLLRSEQQPFIVAADMYELPFGFLDNQGQFMGVYNDILKELFKRLEIPLKHDCSPWKRAQFMVKHGNADGIVTFMTDERSKFLSTTELPLAKHNFRAFAREDHPKFEEMKLYKGLEDFKGLKVLDYLGDHWGAINIKDLNPDVGGSLIEVILKLAAGRGDIFIQAESKVRTRRDILQKNPDYSYLGVEKIRALPLTVAKIDHYLLISKKSSYHYLIPKINKTLNQMREDGSFSKIYLKYFSAK